VKACGKNNSLKGTGKAKRIRPSKKEGFKRIHARKEKKETDLPILPYAPSSSGAWNKFLEHSSRKGERRAEREEK